MTSQTQHVIFSGLDPIPIHLIVAADISQEDLLVAAGIPNSLFIRTVRPFQLLQHDALTYELCLGPKGVGAVLLEALRWLAQITTAGIVGMVASDHLLAFVQYTLTVDKPEWRFEELTEHAAAFIRDRYQRAAADAEYRAALVHLHRDAAWALLVDQLQRWIAKRAQGGLSSTP